MATLDQINRTATVEVLPDGRLRVTRRYDIVDGQATMKDGTKFLANVEIPWGTADVDYTSCRLIKQDVTGQTANENKKPNDPPAYLIRVYEEISAGAETQVGNPSVTYDEDGNINVEIEWIQFSTGAAVNQTVGTTAAPAPYTSAILKEQIATDDGTLRRIKRIYNGDRTISDVTRIRFGGNLLVRTIVAIGDIPPTPSGYTLVGPGTLHPDGRQVYTYEFTAVNGGGTPGTGAEISRGYTNSQGGNIAFDPAVPNGATGDVICTIRYITTIATTANPITQPTGFVLFALDVQDQDGYRMWESRSGFGGGNSISVDVDGAPDGALIYTVSQNDANGSTVPAYPGSGTAYNTKLTHTRDNGFWRNVAVWHKPPATDTYTEQMEFEEPGIAEFVGSPPQFVKRPPKQRTLLVSVEVSYATTQISNAPFDIEGYASFTETYTPTDTGVAITNSIGLGGYLAQASGISGTNSNYNGILCDSWEAELISSVPSTFPTGATVLKADNKPYLTDIAGVKIYRRTKISYTF